MKQRKWIVLGLVIVLIVIGSLTIKSSNTKDTNSKLQVVAAENFWGSLVGQLGGNRVQVKSIVTDPNADPHEYESSSADAKAFTSANYVILNGVGYDTWANKLLSAQSDPNRKVLTVANLVGVKNGGNPHLWYNPSFVNKMVIQMDNDLIGLDPNGAAYYKTQLTKLQSQLALYQSNINKIKTRFAGVEVASTESIFVYVANASGLDLVSPSSFMEAISEGNDPPVNSVVEFENQLKGGKVKLLIYNTQTITPITQNMKQLAMQNNIPIVGISETLQPVGGSFQTWMNNEMLSIYNALESESQGD